MSTGIQIDPIEELADKASDSRETTHSLEDLIAKLPKKFTVDYHQQSLAIYEPWFGLVSLVAIGAIVLLLGPGLVFFDFENATLGGVEVPIAGFSIAVFGLMVAAYWAAGCCFNSTKYKVEDGTLCKTIGPIPWFGECTLPATEIDQLYVQEKIRKRRQHSHFDWDNDPSNSSSSDETYFDTRTWRTRKYHKIPYYRLVARTNDRKLHILSNEYSQPYTPRVLEALLERRLGIEDRFVGDEARDPLT